MSPFLFYISLLSSYLWQSFSLLRYPFLMLPVSSLCTSLLHCHISLVPLLFFPWALLLSQLLSLSLSPIRYYFVLSDFCPFSIQLPFLPACLAAYIIVFVQVLHVLYWWFRELFFFNKELYMLYIIRRVTFY